MYVDRLSIYDHLSIDDQDNSMGAEVSSGLNDFCTPRSDVSGSYEVTACCRPSKSDQAELEFMVSHIQTLLPNIGINIGNDSLNFRRELD